VPSGRYALGKIGKKALPAIEKLLDDDQELLKLGGLLALREHDRIPEGVQNPELRASIERKLGRAGSN